MSRDRTIKNQARRIGRRSGNNRNRKAMLRFFSHRHGHGFFFPAPADVFLSLRIEQHEPTRVSRSYGASGTSVVSTQNIPYLSCGDELASPGTRYTNNSAELTGHMTSYSRSVLRGCVLRHAETPAHLCVARRACPIDGKSVCLSTGSTLTSTACTEKRWLGRRRRVR